MCNGCNCTYRFERRSNHSNLHSLILKSFILVTLLKGCNGSTKRNIYSFLLTPEGMDWRKKTCRGRTFHFPRSTEQLSSKRSEAGQSWRSRKGKSFPKTSFVLTKIQFPSGVRWGDTFFHSIGVCSTKRSKSVTLFKNLKSKFPGVPLKIVGRRPAIFQKSGS